ncbi:MAG TPA: alanine dehydrogenase [Opitutaceae bacterium]|nr:alanine dehydrogenase [Opitutaceae bacterium]
MTIGVPKEIKTGETRVAITPSLCTRVTRSGARVLIEKGAGLRAGFTDSAYRAAGASLVATADRLWRAADLILKVKEPLPEEFARIQNGQTIFTYLHLAAAPELARELVRKNVLGIGYETVESPDATLPLLKPMSQIAGRLATQVGAHFLESQHGGAGVLLGGVPGVAPAHVVVIGAGNSGAHAARLAVGMGARVTVLDLDSHKLDILDSEYHGRVALLQASPGNIATACADADLLIGAVLVPGARAPVVVSSAMVRTMRPGSVIVDIAVDQGGCIETTRATSHEQPTFVQHGVVHYAVPNMPAMVGRTSTLALTNATEPFVVALAQHGVAAALEQVRGLAAGINTRAGRIVHRTVARALGEKAELIPPATSRGNDGVH